MKYEWAKKIEKSLQNEKLFFVYFWLSNFFRYLSDLKFIFDLSSHLLKKWWNGDPPGFQNSCNAGVVPHPEAGQTDWSWRIGNLCRLPLCLWAWYYKHLQLYVNIREDGFKDIKTDAKPFSKSNIWFYIIT